MTDSLERLRAALADRYAVERELGRGRTATVYLATDLRHDRPVALKVMERELASVLGPERFLREIQTTARLTHPHILPLLDSGDADGTLFYVMPYVAGESLRERLTKEKQLPLDDALRIAREVADALSYAHAQGVIHRDIKPENILLEAGHAVVADFGIARAIDVAGGDRLTETGIAIGTPAYMSPEQASGSRELDGRSDLYSLACVLYEMLTGKPPFVGPTAGSLIQQHLAAEPPSVTVVRPSVPGWVAAALTRALAKTPADRFNPVAQFGEALGQGASAALTSTAVRARRDLSGQRVALLAVVAMALFAALVATVRWMRLTASVPTHPRTSVAVLPFENLSAEEQSAYLARGLHAVLNAQLGKVAALTVIELTSVRDYADTNVPLRKVAEELGVGSVVRADVQVIGNRLMATVRLLDALTGAQLWADTYDRTLDDAYAVQSDIARQVVSAVGARLTDSEARAIAARPTPNTDAFIFFLQGEGYRQRFPARPDDLDAAEQLLSRAVELDSTFALAWAALATVQGSQYWLAYDPDPTRLERERKAAETAFRLAPELPQARAAMGLSHYHRRDFHRALEELTAAAAGLPNSAELWETVGYAHRRLGNWDQALAMFEKAAGLDPRNPRLFADLGGWTLLFLHRFDDALEAWTRALELAPDHHGSRLMVARIHLLRQGDLSPLRSLLGRGSETFGAEGSRDLWRARLALWEKQPDSLIALLGLPDTVVFEAQDTWEPGFLFAGWAYQLLGDRSAAAGAFQSALRQLDSALQDLPDDYRIHAARGLALAGLNRREEARKEARWLQASVPAGFDRADKVQYEAVAMILAQIGDTDDALRELEELLRGPSMTSVHTVRLDPRWNAIRADPRFQALLDKYADHPDIR